MRKLVLFLILALIFLGLGIGVSFYVVKFSEKQEKPSITAEELERIPTPITPREEETTDITTSEDKEIPDQKNPPRTLTKIFPDNALCFYLANRNNTECKKFYNNDGYACPQYFNPVFGADGVFYPSACWAEALGEINYTYGYSPSLIGLFNDQWAKEGYNVAHPDIEFTYQGGTFGSKQGTWLRSTLWHDRQSYSVLDYNISTNTESPGFSAVRKNNILIPAISSNPQVLLVYIMFDKAYPENLLIDLTNTYEKLLNIYLKEKQEVPDPIQYDFVPVVIDPPSGVRPITADHASHDSQELDLIYNSAKQKLGGKNDFKIFIASPVIINGFGGYYTIWRNMQFISSPLHPPTVYSTVDKKAGIDALAAFQQMFFTISHEVLHAVGLPGDHVPMNYGVKFLDLPSALDTDLVTGKSKKPSQTACDFFSNSKDYYPVDLLSELRIKVGQELPGWIKIQSSSGDCIMYSLYNNEILKDYKKNGEYQMMYKNNLIGKELQRTLGWIDVDGDGIAELIDPNPYK